MNKRMSIVIVSVLLAATLSAGPVHANDYWSKTDLGKTTLGRKWMGPNVNTEHIKGKVVILEFWGYRCPPCIASLPKLAAIDRKYRKKGLVVIGAHAQGNVKDKAVEIAKSRGVKYTIVSSASVPGVKIRGIPHTIVFDRYGKRVYSGYPNNDMLRAAVKALREGVHPILEYRKIKHFDLAVAKINDEKFGVAWEICKKKKNEEGVKEEVLEEAKYIIERLKNYSDQKLEEAAEMKLKNPIKTIEIYRELKIKFAGAPTAEKATEKLKELREDKKLQTELAAFKRYKQIEEYSSKIPKCPDDENKKANWVSSYSGAVRELQYMVNKMKKQWPESYWTSQAETKLTDILPD